MPDKSDLQEYSKTALSKEILISVLFVTAAAYGGYGLIYLFFLPTNYQTLIMCAFGFLFFSGMYYFVRYKNAFSYVVVLFVPAVLILLSVGWIFIDGVVGGVGYYYVVATTFFIVITPLRYRYWLVALAMINVLIMFMLELYCPNCIYHSQTAGDFKIAMFINILLSITLVTWVMVRTKIEYEKEQIKVKEQNKALVNAHSAKSRFLANVSHEIRTPMNGVMGMASLLEKTNLTEEQQEYVYTIMVSSDRLLRIINQILDYSKAEAGKTELYAQPFSLKQSIKDAIQINAPHALKKQLELTYKIEENIPDILLGDSEKLQQILINLIGNAIKFTHSGSIQITVQCSFSEEERIKLLFAVKDTGIGISGDKIPQLFNAFTQVDDSATRKYSGTGLGLAICKRLVELMGGEIWVESAPNVGSTFYFNCKMEVLPPKTKIPQASSSVIINPLSKVQADLKILIVEDDKINQLLAIRLLEKMGYKPDTANNGLEAVDILKKTHYHLVFMDIQMPVMDGLEATQIIRKNNPQQPIIIAMTANAMPEDKLLCEIAGMDDFIPKPVKLNHLEKIMQKWQHTI